MTKIQHQPHVARPRPDQPPAAQRENLGGAQVTMRGGHLSVRGTKGDDDISVRQLDAKTVEVTVNGETKTFEGVKSVKVNGGKGNDTIRGDALEKDAFDKGGATPMRDSRGKPLHVRIAGGKGDDEISSNFDYAKLLGGHGADTVINDGNDARVRGGRGDDTVLNTGIRAQIRGGAGKDLIVNDGVGASVHGGNGDDRVVNTDAAARINGGRGDDVVQDTTGTAKVRSAALVDDI